MDDSVLITGGAGYIGSHAALCLVDKGWRVVVIDDLSTGSRDLVPEGAVFVEGGVADQALVVDTLERERCTAVMHFAGSVIASESVTNPLKFFRNNVSAGINLIEACVAADIRRFVFSSSAAVYGNNADASTAVTTPVAPISPYGESKRMMEAVIAAAAKAHGFQYAILRYFNVAGADPDGRSGQIMQDPTHLFGNAIRAALEGGPAMEIYGNDYETPDGTCVRDFIHVSDLAEIHIAVLEMLAVGGDRFVLNCGYGKGYSVLETINIVADTAGVAIETRIADRRPGDIVTAVADTASLHDAISWKPSHDIRSIAKTSVDWARRRADAAVDV